MFSRALRSLPDSTFSSHWLMLMLIFALIDGCQFFKTSCLTAKRGKVQLSYIFVYVYIYFFKLLVLERQTILY